MYGISDTQKVLLFWIWSPFQNEFQCVWKLFITILILDNIWHFGFLLRHVICFCCVNYILRKFGTSQVKAQFYVRNSRTVSAVSQVGAAGVCGLPDLFTITPILARKNGQNHVFARIYMKHTQIVLTLNKHEFWRELLPKSRIHSILRIHKSDLQRFEIGGVLARECGRNWTL